MLLKWVSLIAMLLVLGVAWATVSSLVLAPLGVPYVVRLFLAITVGSLAGLPLGRFCGLCK